MEARLTANGGAEGDLFGWPVAAAGDADLDGFDDVLAGATGSGDSGAAWLFFGSVTGIEARAGVQLAEPDASVDALFGCSGAGVGDVDGDGRPDLAVGARWDDAAGNGSGTVWLYRGGEDGIDPASGMAFRDASVESGSNFGSSVSGAGDVDGDGLDGLVVGAPFHGEQGAAFVFREGDLENGVLLEPSDGGLIGGYTTDEYGYDVAGAGDLDADGYDEVVIGSAFHDRNGYQSGSAYVYPGGSAGTDPAGEVGFTPSGIEAGDSFGSSVAGAGDVDGDGFADIAIGAACDGAPDDGTGAFYLYLGTSSGIDLRHPTRTDPPAEGAGDHFGWPASGAGDVDGDGKDDLIVRASWNDPWLDAPAGSVFLYGDTCRRAWFRDADDDGYGDPSTSISTCSSPDGWVTRMGDCDDNDPLVPSDVVELCNGVDDDCDGWVDEDGAVDAPEWHQDRDGDGYGGDGWSTTSCEQPAEGYVDNDDDCDDYNSSVNPGAEEVPGDGTDQDCDGRDALAEPAEDTDTAGGEGDTAGGGAVASTHRRQGCGCHAAPAGGWALPFGLPVLARRRARHR